MEHEPLDRKGPADTRPLGVTPSLSTHPHRTEPAQVYALFGADFAAATRLSTADEAVFALVVLLALAALVARTARLHTRERRLARDIVELSRTVAAVQGWTEQEFRAVRDEFTVARLNESAARAMEQRAQKCVATAETTPELEDDRDEQRDTVAMPASETPTAPPDDEEATTVFDRDPPIYAARHLTMRPPAPREPLAHPDLIGCEDVADEANCPHLGPDETTPPRHGRAALLVPAFRGPEQGQTA